MLQLFRLLCIALALLACSGTQATLQWPALGDVAKCAPPSEALLEAVLDVLAAAPGGKPGPAALVEIEELGREYGPAAVLCVVQAVARGQDGPSVASAATSEAAAEQTRAAAAARTVLELIERLRPPASRVDAPATSPPNGGSAGAGGTSSP